MKNYQVIILSLIFIVLPSISILWNAVNSSRISNIYDLLAWYTSDHVTRDIEKNLASLSGEVSDTNDRIDHLRNDMHQALDNIRTTQHAKIYNLEITICRTDKIDNVIEKRKIQMNNIVAINPSLSIPSSSYLDTWLGYGNEIEIPDHGLMNDADTYTCWLKILSIK